MFQYFDLDKKGAIDAQNIKETFKRGGNKIGTEDVIEMIKEINPGTNVISFNKLYGVTRKIRKYKI